MLKASNGRRTGAGLLCVALMAVAATPAFAETPAPTTDDYLEIVASISPESLASTAEANSQDSENAEYFESEVFVSVPWQADDAAVLKGDLNELQVKLPFSDVAADAILLQDGVTLFDNGNSSVTIPVARDDGSLQILTVIDSEEAPSRYDYRISVPTGGAMTLDEASGVVMIKDATGEFAGVVAPAWARDANGTDVTTKYEINGEILTQVIDHTSAAKYPVVADPWLGVQLFSNFSRDWYKNQYRHNAFVTPLGAVILGGGGGVGGYLAGQAVFRGAGWSEWKARYPGITAKATNQQQYNCHVTASVYGLPFTKDYNLEQVRANFPNWLPTVAKHRCNW